MKDIQLAVITTLKADTAVAALVSARVYRAAIPSDPTYPCIAVTRIDKISEDTSSSEYMTTRIQCTVFATSDAAAENLSDLVLAALKIKENSLVSGVEICTVDDAGAVPDNSDALTLGVYRDNHDFMITYRSR